eukprot:393698-Rhodomonas_salina.3
MAPPELDDETKQRLAALEAELEANRISAEEHAVQVNVPRRLTPSVLCGVRHAQGVDVKGTDRRLMLKALARGRMWMAVTCDLGCVARAALGGDPRLEAFSPDLSPLSPRSPEHPPYGLRNLKDTPGIAQGHAWY